jgi:hypothetical protein
VTAATAALEQQQQHLTRKLMQILEVVTEALKKGTGKKEFAFLLKLEFSFLGHCYPPLIALSSCSWLITHK